MEIYIFWSLLVSLFTAYFLSYFLARKKKLDSKTVQFLKAKLYTIKNDTISTNEKIIVLDTLFHHILKVLGYKGSMGDILKKKPKEIKNIDEIWRLHTLRNSLVHDIEHIGKDSYSKEVKGYIGIIESFLESVKG